MAAPLQSTHAGYNNAAKTLTDRYYINAHSLGPAGPNGHQGGQPAKPPPALHVDPTSGTRFAIVNVFLGNSTSQQNDVHPESVLFAISTLEQMAASGNLHAYLELPNNVDIQLRVWNVYGTRNVNNMSCTMIEILNRTGQPEHLICFMLGRLHHKLDVLRAIQENSILHCMFPAMLPLGHPNLHIDPNIRPMCLDTYNHLQLATALTEPTEGQFAGYTLGIGVSLRNSGGPQTMFNILAGNSCSFHS